MNKKIWLLGILGMAGCSDYEFYNQKYTDVFQQNGRNKVDVLLVVDNSCSMFEEQDKAGKKGILKTLFSTSWIWK